MSIKIISGKLKGSKIEVPGSARPTLQRSRQSLFDTLESLSRNHGHFFENKTILDCFAGSGALGIEALSRGAKFAYFIDASSDAINIIHENIKKFQLQNFSTVMKADVLRVKNPNKNNPCDLVFIDPPYGKVSIKKTIDHLCSEKWIDSNTLIITEEDTKYSETLDDNLQYITKRIVGRAMFRIVTIKASPY